MVYPWRTGRGLTMEAYACKKSSSWHPIRLRSNFNVNDILTSQIKNINHHVGGP